jgi:iron complex outermembrane receptor protein
VVNVVTRKARETQGLLITGGAGTHEQGFGTVRYGAEVAEDVFFRVYGKYFNRDNFEFRNGLDAPDDWDMIRGGFRLDFESDPDTTVTLQGDIYDGDVGSPIVVKSLTPPLVSSLRDDQTVRGGNVLGRVEHLVSADAGWTLQAYYDRAERRRPDFFDDERDTFDVEFRHHFALGERHDLIWGAGYRHRRDETSGSLTLSFDPSDDDLDKFSAFVQDTITVVDDRLTVMLGSKFEHNDFTGFEVQPGARLAWTPSDRQLLWGAVSRAVRTPSRANHDLLFTTAVLTPPDVPEPTPVQLVGDSGFDSEELLAFELGYRVRAHDGLTLDIAGFYNDYDELSSLGAPTADPFQTTFSNDTDGESYGLELTARWDAAENWRLAASYSFLRVQLHGFDESDERSSPQNQFSIRSYLDITKNLELNAAAYYVDNVPGADAPAYTRLDLGLTWRPAPNVELAVWGQNLLDDQHVEFRDSFFVVSPIEVERGVYAQLSLRF